MSDEWWANTRYPDDIRRAMLAAAPKEAWVSVEDELPPEGEWHWATDGEHFWLSKFARPIDPSWTDDDSREVFLRAIIAWASLAETSAVSAALQTRKSPARESDDG